MIARNDEGGEPLETRVFMFTEKDYALIGPGGETASCRAWTRRKFQRWLDCGMLIPIIGESGVPEFTVEYSEPGAVERGCYWMRVRSLVGGFPLYALLSWPFASEVGRMFGVELVDPRE